MERNQRAISPSARQMSAQNADYEIENHDLDILNPLDPRLGSPDQTNPYGVKNVPVSKTWVGGSLLGHLDGISVNTLNQSSLESLGPRDLSALSAEFGPSLDSLGPDSRASGPKFDSKTKSKFYNSLLRLNPSTSASPTGSPTQKGSPIRKDGKTGGGLGSPTPGSPMGKLEHALDMERMFGGGGGGSNSSSNAEAGGAEGSRRGSRIIAWPAEGEQSSAASASAEERRETVHFSSKTAQKGGMSLIQEGQGGGRRLIPNTPILLPGIKSTLGTKRTANGPKTSHIAMNLRPRTTGKEPAVNFMNSTFHDGNSNMSQSRHKLDGTAKPLCASASSASKASSKRKQRALVEAAIEAEGDNYGAQRASSRRPSDASISSLASLRTVGSWADVTGREGKVYDVGPVDKEAKDIASTTFSKKQTKVLTKVSTLLDAEQVMATATLSQARQELLLEADAMVAQLPLQYLFSKQKLRHYALKIARTAFLKMTTIKINNCLRRTLAIWKEPPVVVMNEEQIGFMVISKRLVQMYKSIIRVKFNKWAFAYSPRFQEDRRELPNQMARQIQIWWRDIRVTSKQLFKNLWVAVKMCLQRREAIRHMIEFEQYRRSSMLKMHRVIQKRRRIYYAARSIMRNYAWFKLYRKTQTRLTRLAHVRVIQRFYRMKQCRHRLELHLITNVLRYGGYSVVYPKIPGRFLHGGFLQSINMVTAIIQRAWFTSKGNYAAFIVAAARRAKEEHMQMLNDNALILQHNWVGTLWKILNTTARDWNRARRISFAFRHYQYRCWNYPLLVERRHRYARVLQRWLRNLYSKYFLTYRFKVRRAMIMVFKRKQWEGAIAMQREYRAYKERERIRHEAFVKLVEMQRSQSELVMKNIKKIQKAWRKHLKGGRGFYVGNQFARHIYLITWREVRKQRRTLHDNAITIQRFVRPKIKRMKDEREEERIDSANCIWSLGKAYVLKLAVWDRIMATRRIQRIAANLMKKNLRLFMWYRHIKIRCILRVYQKKYTAFRNTAASKMQRWFNRKWAEYYLPLREAGRLNVSKKRKLELQRIIDQRLDKSARVIVRFFTPWNGHWIEKVDHLGIRRALWRGTSWSFIRLVQERAAKEARYYVERKAAKKMQRYSRKVIAWARFDKIAAYRKKQINEHEKEARWIQAANVIGTYWYRRGEKYTLNERFKLRRKMLDEYERLDQLKLVAYAERAEAFRLKKITDDNMIATINASWKQGSDVTGRNYYYNYVTGETSWTPPEHFKAPVKDTWLRQQDEKANVYYYNMFTGESSWLPPCVECGEQAERYCGNCKMSYCERCHETKHGEDADEEWQDHVWALTEYAKEELLGGEIYCQECKKKAAAVTCMQCWDHYCKDCFKYTHAAGNLKYHPTQNYHKAKKGWMCIKSKTLGEPDYYMHGGTGVTTYEKPVELYTADEKLFFDQFMDHKHQAETFIEQLKTLQYELEDTKYERDVIFQRALEQGTSMADILKRRKDKKKLLGTLFSATDDQKDTIQEVSKRIQPSFWGGITAAMSEYKISLLAPQNRKRGNQKSEYMKSLLEAGAEHQLNK